MFRVMWLYPLSEGLSNEQTLCTAGTPVRSYMLLAELDVGSIVDRKRRLRLIQIGSL